MSGRSWCALTEPLWAIGGKSPYAIDLASEERAELEQRAACFTVTHKEVQRATMICGTDPGTQPRSPVSSTSASYSRTLGPTMEADIPAGSPGDLHTLFVAGFNRGDLDALLELYEPEAAVVTATPGTVIHGLDAIRDVLAGLLAYKGQITINTRWVSTAGDLALLHGEWVLPGTNPTTGQPVTISALNTEVARRQVDGRWLFSIDDPFGNVEP